MYLFKTSGATFNSVIENQKHAFPGAPQLWNKGEVVIVSKNSNDCIPGELQIQYTMKMQSVRPATDEEVERYWPGNSGRWRYIVDCSDTERINLPFNLQDVIGDSYSRYRTVINFKRFAREDEEKILARLLRQ